MKHTHFAQGTVHEATGIFPCAFVKIIQDLPPEEGTIDWLRCYYQDDAVGSIRDISVEEDLSSTPLFKHLMALMRRSSCQELRTERASDPPAVRRLSHRQLLAQVTKKQ
ncbi:unnamed protein product [Caretta caretta]